MARAHEAEPFRVAPYFDDLLCRLEAGDPVATAAFGRHVHWGYWPDPSAADGTAADYAAAAERLCRAVCDAADIGEGMSVLDVGCGFGGTIASLNERFAGLNLVGVNIDPRQIRRAAATVPPRPGNDIRFVVGDACQLDFPEATFDRALAVECIFHFPSRADFFRGAARSLKPGGRLALSDFVPPKENVELLRKFNPANDEASRAAYGALNVLTTVEDYRELADAAGMTLLDVRDITAQTMPTYEFLQADLQSRPDRAAAKIHSRATGRIEMACRHDLLRYTVLTFGRRATAVGATA